MRFWFKVCSSLRSNSMSGLSTTSFFIISAATTSCRYTFTVSSGRRVLGVADMRISTAGLIWSSTAADLSAVFDQNMCSSSIIATMGRPASSCVRRAISYSEAVLSLSRTMTFVSLLTLSQFTNSISPGRIPSLCSNSSNITGLSLRVSLKAPFSFL